MRFPRHVATARYQTAEKPVVPDGRIFQLAPGRLLRSLVLHRCRHVLFTIGADDKSRVYGKPERLDHECYRGLRKKRRDFVHSQFEVLP